MVSKCLISLGALCLAQSLHAALLFPQLQHPMALPPDVSLSRAADAINALQSFYNQTTGLWDSTGWWNSANCLTVYAEYVAFNPAIQDDGLKIFSNTFEQAQSFNIPYYSVVSPQRFVLMNEHFIEVPGQNKTKRDDQGAAVTINGSSQNSPSTQSQYPRGEDMPEAQSFPGFINDFYDDEGWWALGWLQAWEASNRTETRYLSTTEAIFEDMVQGWSNGTTNLTSCEGVWWDKKRTAINAVENELFISLAASLANRVPEKKDYYLGWAQKTWQWFQGTGMINKYNTINDGIDLSTCKTNGQTAWTYNQGVILGGLVELNKAAPNDDLLAIANTIADAAIERFTEGNSGTLQEICDPYCGRDGQQFKGIFVRNLYKLWAVTGKAGYLEIIQRNAESIYTSDRGPGNVFGPDWSGPFLDQQANAGTHSSASDAVVAAAMAAGLPS